MSGSDRIANQSPHHKLFRLWPVVVMLVVSSVTMSVSASASASAYRIDLRVLVLDDDSPWVDAIVSQMQIEGVPYTAVPPSSATITADFLARETERSIKPLSYRAPRSRVWISTSRRRSAPTRRSSASAKSMPTTGPTPAVGLNSRGCVRRYRRHDRHGHCGRSQRWVRVPERPGAVSRSGAIAMSPSRWHLRRCRPGRVTRRCSVHRCPTERRAR